MKAFPWQCSRDMCIVLVIYHFLTHINSGFYQNAFTTTTADRESKATSGIPPKSKRGVRDLSRVRRF